MTTDEMRLAIAEHLPEITIQNLTLDELHEAENQLFEMEKSGFRDYADIYDNELSKIAYREALFFGWHFTAEQRAEAFVKTIGKWKD